jgi:hypothetical protein
LTFFRSLYIISLIPKFQKPVPETSPKPDVHDDDVPSVSGYLPRPDRDAVDNLPIPNVEDDDIPLIVRRLPRSDHAVINVASPLPKVPITVYKLYLKFDTIISPFIISFHPKFRKPVPEAPLVNESASPQPKAKRAVPPSPQSRQISNRDLALNCKFLETQAVEVNEDDESQSGSSNSADDQDMSNLSYVTNGAVAP